MQMPAFVQSQAFWEVAFVIALLLLIFSHKITVEGMVSA
jgi:hypothetical protein